MYVPMHSLPFSKIRVQVETGSFSIMLKYLLFAVLANGMAGEMMRVYVSSGNGADIPGNGLSNQSAFRTIQYAQNYVNEAKLHHNGEIKVEIMQGVYYLNDTLTFQFNDGGNSASAFIEYRAYCDHRGDTTVITNYPYITKSTERLRYLWNGVGNELEFNYTAEEEYYPTPSPTVFDTPVADLVNASNLNNDTKYCIDRIGLGHYCYYGHMADCVMSCAESCDKNVHKRVYTEEFYDSFLHLFGKDLRLEEECTENCISRCTYCDPVVISGFTPPMRFNWTVLQTLANGNTIYVADFVHKEFDTLYFNGKMQRRTRYPNQVNV